MFAVKKDESKNLLRLELARIANTLAWDLKQLAAMGPNNVYSSQLEKNIQALRVERDDLLSKITSM